MHIFQSLFVLFAIIAIINCDEHDHKVKLKDLIHRFFLI